MHTATAAQTGPGPRLILVLLALLVAQIGLALYLGRADEAPATAGKGQLLAFDPAQVERIQIDQRAADPLVLERTDQGWKIQSLGGFPAAADRVEALLARLAGLKRGLPVATSADALARLKVADTDHEGHLTLEAGDKTLAELYLGDGAGARHRYVRVAGEEAVQEAELSVADLPAKADDWADHGLLDIDQADIKRITLAGIVLERDGDAWRLADVKEGETLDQPKTQDLVRNLANLSFSAVLGNEDKPEYGQTSPTLEWQIELDSGDTRDYRLSRLHEVSDQAQGETVNQGPAWYVLKVADLPYYLKLAGYAAEPLTGVSRTGLLVQPETGHEAAPQPQVEPPQAEDQAAIPPADAEPATDQQEKSNSAANHAD